jgi:hypothetical protein
MERIDDAPVNRKAKSYADYFAIVTHPAVRIGFLDAQNGRAFDHDHIIARIKNETPKGALKRLGWEADLFDHATVALAQYRYEEGRLLVTSEGLKCKAWGHPDFPPAQVRNLIWTFAERDRAEMPSSPPTTGGSIVAALRGPTPPLLERMRA